MNFYLATNFLSDLLVKSFGMKTLSGEVLEIAKKHHIPRGYLNDRCSYKRSINEFASKRLIELFDSVLSDASRATKDQAVDGLCTVLANCFAFSKEQISEVVDTFDEESGNELLLDLLKIALDSFTNEISARLPFAFSTGIQTIRFYDLPDTVPILADTSGNALILLTDIPENARALMLKLE